MSEFNPGPDPEDDSPWEESSFLPTMTLADLHKIVKDYDQPEDTQTMMLAGELLILRQRIEVALMIIDKVIYGELADELIMQVKFTLLGGPAFSPDSPEGL